MRSDIRVGELFYSSDRIKMRLTATDHGWNECMNNQIMKITRASDNEFDVPSIRAVPVNFHDAEWVENNAWGWLYYHPADIRILNSEFT
jgi:hypothetical protein